MPQTKQQPYDLKPAKLKGFKDYEELARWLCLELDHAIDARSHLDYQLDYWHRIYEQDRTRLENNRPKPNGADLTSPIGTQYVDSLHARTMQTLFVEPIWTVEGWSDSVQKAPYVEEFHQWTAEDERLQSYVDRAIHNSWIDSEGILEVAEAIDYRPVRRTIWAMLETEMDALTGEGKAVIGEDNQPKYLMEHGKYVEVNPPMEGEEIPFGIAQTEIDDYQPVRVGPEYRVIDLRDFWSLPGHASDKAEIWGYAKRFFRRYSYLKEKVADGIYAKEACEKIGPQNDREPTLDDARMQRTLATQDGHTAEKELFEIAFLRNLDGTGERWWVATVHKESHTLLRLKYDDLGTQIGFGRFVRFVPLPRKNSIGGFSVIGHKLITIIEEHTAIRNMRADGAALRNSAVVKVQQGALYDPEENPLGPGAVIYCRDMNEVQVMEFPDVTDAADKWAHEVIDAAERTMGVNDVASGLETAESKTLGEVQLVTSNSEIRIALVTKRLQEPMEDLGQIRHVIWKRVLASQGDGMDVPQRAMSGLEARGVDIAMIQGGKFTADLLEGKYKFKPRGSVETADLNRQRFDFNQFLQTIPALMQVNPMIAAMLGTPDAARALLENALRVNRVPDKQAFLGSPSQSAMGTAGLIQDPRVQQILMGGGAASAGRPDAGMGPAGVPPGMPAAPPSMPQGVM